MRLVRCGIASLCLVLCAGLTGCSKKAEPGQSEALLIVLNKSENTATLFHEESGQVLGVVVTGVGPHEVDAHSERGLAVVSNYGTPGNPGSTLTVIDLAARRGHKTINLERFRRPHGVVFFADGRRVAVTVEEQRSLLVVNIDTGAIERVLRTDQEMSHLVVLSPDETRAYVSNLGSGTVSVMDLTENRLIKVVETGRGAEGLDLSPDGGELWVTNRTADTLSILDTQELEVVARMECAGFPIRIRFTPEGGYVLVSNSYSGDVAVFSAAERRELLRIDMELAAAGTTDPGVELNPVPVGIVVSPDGRRAYVAHGNVDLISVIDTFRWQIIDRFHAGDDPDGMALAVVGVGY